MILSSSEGLLLAAGCSVANVGMDVTQKRALTHRPLLATLLVGRLFVFLWLTLFALLRARYTHHAPWTVLLDLRLPHSAAFMGASAFDCVVVTLSGLLYYRAIQKSPLSLTIPYLTFTPAFLLITQYIFLGERSSWLQCLAVAVILYGSILLNRASFRLDCSITLRGLLTETGSRYMLLAALLMSITNVLDQWLVRKSDSETFAWLYSAGLALTFFVLWLSRVRRQTALSAVAWVPCGVAAATDACALQLQFAALHFLSPVVVVSVKRSGVLLSLVAGRLFFHDRSALARLPAACVMLAGALMLYLHPSPWLQVSIAMLAIAFGTASIPFKNNVVDHDESPG